MENDKSEGRTHHKLIFRECVCSHCNLDTNWVVYSLSWRASEYNGKINLRQSTYIMLFNLASRPRSNFRVKVFSRILNSIFCILVTKIFGGSPTEYVIDLNDIALNFNDHCFFEKIFNFEQDRISALNKAIFSHNPDHVYASCYLSSIVDITDD